MLSSSTPLFENDVKTYGTETTVEPLLFLNTFENNVKTYGTETQIRQLQYPLVFENDVKMYGTETDVRMEYVKMRLKMM